MQKNKTSFSIVIIGFNTSLELKRLLDSVENIQYYKENVEIIYIDDGSTDLSLQCFNNHPSQFQKKSFGFKKNKGRVFATQKGIEIANHDWIFFLQSNMTVEPNILKVYSRSIKYNKAIAFGGSIQYTSSDLKFNQYLNHNKRGIRQYKQNQIVRYKHLLFGNSIIKKSIFKKISLNCQLKQYGGEELDFAYRLNKKYPNQIMACTSAITTRIDHPALLQHSSRLIEFGKYNFPLLDETLQKSIIYYRGFLRWKLLFKWPIIILNKLFLCLYFLRIRTFLIIKLILFTSILKGFYCQPS